MPRRRFLMIATLLAIPAFAHAQAPKPLPPAEAKVAFLKLLDRPKVPLDVKLDPAAGLGELYRHRLSIASDKKADGTIERVPILIVRPPHEPGILERRPTIILLHGTGGSKEGMNSWLEEFARKGYVAVGIDARYHGERVPNVKGSTAYVEAITKAWKTPTDKPMEHPFYYDTVWDLWRVLDYLETRADVDKSRIAMLGISMGGIQTWLAASVDDRVKVAAPLIGVQSFRWSLENDRWQGRANTIKAAHEAAAKDLGEAAVNQKVCRELWGKVIPGILSDFDCPNLLPLFADRALFISNGDKDPNCPVEGARIAIKSAEEAFAKANRKDKLEVHVGEGVGHTVTPEHHAAVVAFIEKQFGTVPKPK